MFYLWALGVAAVISGDFSGWNLGFAVGGWGGMFLGAIIITVMYLGLTYSIAEMSPALPHTGGAYSFARTSFGPWGGFITGVAENVEYVLTPAVVVSFIGTYLTAVFDTPTACPAGVLGRRLIVFVGLNARGVELSFRCHRGRDLAGDRLLVGVLRQRDARCSISAIRDEYRRRSRDRRRQSSCRRATARCCRSASTACSPRCPSRCGCSSPSSSCRWPPKNRSIPNATCRSGIMLGMFTLIALGFLVLIFNPAIPIERV